MEPIEYSFVLKSQYGYISSTGVLNGTTAVGNNNDLTFNISNFIQRISSYGTKKFKLVFEGGLVFVVPNAGFSYNSSDFGVGIASTMDTLVSNAIKSFGWLSGTLNETQRLKDYHGSSLLARQNDIYILDISQCNYIRILFNNSLFDTTVSNTKVAPYSLMFKLIPMID